MPRATKDQDGEPHPIDKHVGGRVKERRISLGYNQSDLARALGLTFQQVQKYESGANRISSSKLWDTARFLKCSILDFFPEEGTELADIPEDVGFVEDQQSFRLMSAFRKIPRVGGQRKLVVLMAEALATGETEA